MFFTLSKSVVYLHQSRMNYFGNLLIQKMNLWVSKKLSQNYRRTKMHAAVTKKQRIKGLKINLNRETYEVKTQKETFYLWQFLIVLEGTFQNSKILLSFWNYSSVLMPILYWVFERNGGSCLCKSQNKIECIKLKINCIGSLKLLQIQTTFRFKIYR